VTRRKIFVLDDEIRDEPGYTGGYENRVILLEALKGHDLTIALTVEEAKAKWGDGRWDFVCLDHDLGGYPERTNHPNTGTAFLKWLLKEPLPLPLVVFLHSVNPPGRGSMVGLIRDYQRQFPKAPEIRWQETPFSQAYVQALQGMLGD
jgi:hypothetical protein